MREIWYHTYRFDGYWLAYCPAFGVLASGDERSDAVGEMLRGVQGLMLLSGGGSVEFIERDAPEDDKYLRLDWPDVFSLGQLLAGCN